MLIRNIRPDDENEVWKILEPVIRPGETYPLPRDMDKTSALAYWLGSEHEVFVAEETSRLVGTYFLQANQRGGGSHVANCGYVTAAFATGRGVARAMCEHSLKRAQERGFCAIQFNFVVSSNVRAVGLWESMGFSVVGRLAAAFHHPERGCVDALVMFRNL